MATMTVSEAYYIVHDIVAPALLSTRGGHARKPVSLLKGYDLVQICTPFNLLIANAFLLYANRDVFEEAVAEEKFAGCLKDYHVPLAALSLFVPDDQVDVLCAKPALDFDDPRFLSQETASSFAQYCRSVGADDPLYWQKVYSRLGLEYTANSPRGNDTQPPECDLYDSGIRDHFQSIVSAFTDTISSNPRYIGDCSNLPHPKKTILYAIRWLMDHYERRLEGADATDRAAIRPYLKSLSWLLTHVARDWHQIEPADEDAVAKLNKCISFPDWALPLKAKYIDEDAARNEALDITVEVIEDTVACEKRRRVSVEERRLNGQFEHDDRAHGVTGEEARKASGVTGYAAARKLAISRAIEENKNVTHAQFVVGMQNNVIGFACLGQRHRLITGVRRTVFTLLAMLYQIGPLLLVPLWAYHESNWWLLIGIAVSWVATARTANSASVVLKGKATGGFLGFLCLVLWISLGIHNYWTFFALSAMWGCLLFQMAEAAERDYATQCLVENPELFERAMARGVITIARRWDKPPYEDWQDGEPDRAIADCTNAIRLGLRWPGMYLDRGRAHAAKGEYDEAIADYTEAIRLDPKDYAAHEWRGMAYKAKGEDEKAALDVDEFKRLMHEAGARLQQGG